MKNILKGALSLAIFLLAVGITYFIVKSATNKAVEEITPPITITREDIVTQLKELDVQEPRQEFMTGCLEESPEQEDYCNCAYDEIIAQVGSDGFIKMALEMTSENSLSDETIDIMATTIETCMPEYK